MLHQINRRTTARITSQDFDPNSAPSKSRMDEIQIVKDYTFFVHLSMNVFSKNTLLF